MLIRTRPLCRARLFHFRKIEEGFRDSGEHNYEEKWYNRKYCVVTLYGQADVPREVSGGRADRVVKAMSGVSLTSMRIPWNNNGHITVTSQ